MKTKRPREKATEAVKYLESVSYYEDTKFEGETQEVVGISEAIRATILAEVTALTWALDNNKNAVLSRINDLKTIL